MTDVETSSTKEIVKDNIQEDNYNIIIVMHPLGDEYYEHNYILVKPDNLKLSEITKTSGYYLNEDQKKIIQEFLDGKHGVETIKGHEVNNGGISTFFVYKHIQEVITVFC